MGIRIESQLNGKSCDMAGTLEEAIRVAFEHCDTPWSGWSIWEGSTRVAEVCPARNPHRAYWVAAAYRETLGA